MEDITGNMSQNVALGILQLVALTLPVLVILSDLILSKMDRDEMEKFEISLVMGLSAIAFILAAGFSASHLYNTVLSSYLEYALVFTSFGLLGLLGLFALLILFAKEEAEENSIMSVFEDEGNIFRQLEFSMRKEGVDTVSELDNEVDLPSEISSMTYEEVKENAEIIDESLKYRSMNFIEGSLYKISDVITNPIKFIKENPLLIIIFLLGFLSSITNLTLFKFTPINLLLYAIVLFSIVYIFEEIYYYIVSK